MRNISGLEWVGNKSTISEAHRVVGEYVVVRVFLLAGSGLLSVTDTQRQFVEYCAAVDGLGNNDGD